MVNFNFADMYRRAGIDPQRDIIELRQQSFEQLRQSLSVEQVVDLARLYFSLPDPSGNNFEWFRESFAVHDQGFSLVENEREAAVLGSCLLATALHDGDAQAGLAALSCSVAGNRKPVVLPDLLAELSEALDSYSIDARKRARIDAETITIPTSSTFAIRADELETNDATIKALRRLSNTVHQPTAQLADQVKSVVTPLVDQLVDLREEVDILWWHVGGWSRILNRPFADLDMALASVMCGIDLARLTMNPPGGVAAPAVLQRTISAGRSGKQGKTKARTLVSLQEAVDGFPPDSFELLSFGDPIEPLLDACPVLAAFQKAATIGPSPEWHASFQRSTGLDPSISFSPLDLSMQSYRESLLLAYFE